MVLRISLPLSAHTFGLHSTAGVRYSVGHNYSSPKPPPTASHVALCVRSGSTVGSLNSITKITIRMRSCSVCVCVRESAFAWCSGFLFVPPHAQQTTEPIRSNSAAQNRQDTRAQNRTRSSLSLSLLGGRGGGWIGCRLFGCRIIRWQAEQTHTHTRSRTSECRN